MSHILFEKPHSLSYQAEIFPIFLPTTLVKDKSTIAEAELWLKSIDTSFSDVTSKTFFVCFFVAFIKAALIVSLFISF